MSLDNVLWFANVLIEAAVVGLLLYRRVWRTFPIFCVYCAFDLLTNVGNYAVLRYFLASYTTIYLVETVLDSALEFGILVELSWSVLRPLRASLSRSILVVVGVLIVAAGAAIWPFSVIHGLASLPPAWRTLVHVQQTASILRILFFLVLAGCSQLLSINWRDRELQIATGLGFYSIVSLAVTMLQTHQTMGSQYKHLNQAVLASYSFSLLYWVFSFAQKEAERREFSPQMQSLLLAMAGTARSTRIALAESAADKSRDRRD